MSKVYLIFEGAPHSIAIVEYSAVEDAERDVKFYGLQDYAIVKGKLLHGVADENWGCM